MYKDEDIVDAHGKHEERDDFRDNEGGPNAKDGEESDRRGDREDDEGNGKQPQPDL